MSNKNKKSLGEVANAKVENVENVNVEGLGSIEKTENESGEESVVVTDPNVDYSDRKFLEENEPVFKQEFISKKYDTEREPKVQEGLKVVAELMGEKINPLVILLGKWWEVKPARAAIKKMIDEEARKNNQPEDFYLQITLRKNVDKLSTVQQAVDRMRYAITYFKPRAGVNSKEVFKPMGINGIMYNVSLTKLEEARQLFGDDKEGLKNHLAEISEKIQIEEIL